MKYSCVVNFLFQKNHLKMMEFFFAFAFVEGIATFLPIDYNFKSSLKKISLVKPKNCLGMLVGLVP
jgi:hypothetical protein